MVDMLRDDDSVEFFDGTARGELMIKQCEACGHYLRPDAMACSKCHGSELSWTKSSGRGSLVSWIVVHGPTSAVVGLVELDEGPWLHGRLVASTPCRSRSVTRSRSTSKHAGEEKIPVFRPA